MRAHGTGDSASSNRGERGSVMEFKKFVPACVGAALSLTFFGFMHGESVGIAVTPSVALAYAVVAAFLFALSRAPAAVSVPSMSGEPKVVAAE